MGGGAQQEENRGRKDLEIFSPCSFCGNCWLGYSRERLAGLSRGTGCTVSSGVRLARGHTSLGAEELLQPWGPREDPPVSPEDGTRAGHGVALTEF